MLQEHASPAAKKILTKKTIAPASVTGTGKGGRVTKNDV
jgi:2-oxoglutarate dehydrogenase E2 component (dihydrolipoamide succinyltransferase)